MEVSAVRWENQAVFNDKGGEKNNLRKIGH